MPSSFRMVKLCYYYTRLSCIYQRLKRKNICDIIGQKRGVFAVKIGLLLEGGAMRGIYTAGVLDLFMDNNISFDVITGVSAGTVHGLSYISGQRGRGIRYFTKYCGDKRFMSYRSLITTGNYFGVQFGYDEIPNRLDPFDNDAFDNNPTQFYATTTDLLTGAPYYAKLDTLRGENMKYVQASASMPLVSKIVTVNNKQLLDGGIADSIPIDFMLSLGCDKIVAVLTRPKGYQKRSTTLLPYKLFYGNYPNFVTAMANRADNYNQSVKKIESLERQGKALVIRPTINYKISRTEKDPNKLRMQYNLGYSDASALLEDIKKYIT